jgi:hypothetical protein|tara:strand:+ start:6015 stop:6509 length:495 start_codon:yes stop_codon:yes gene_type:complete
MVVNNHQVQAVYYKDYDFLKLRCSKSIRSHLGTLKKYNPEAIRIQFPKIRIHEIQGDVWSIDFSEKGEDFLLKLQTFNENKRGNKDLILFNKLIEGKPKIVQMKVNDSTLYFNENNEIVDYSYIVENFKNVEARCIASTNGLWFTETSYGNTWIIDQVKIYTNP